jgi:NAD(P)-dependent dehydrogenase (short-subunit alcohol dehydrogenase family)
MKLDLSNQIILVTGASRGIGKAIAETLGESGATVAVHYNRNQVEAEKIADRIGNRSRAFQADLSKPKEAASLGKNVRAFYGEVHCLVNNAGRAEGVSMDMADDAWIASWQRTQDVNLLSAAVLCKELIPAMISNRGGRLIHIASRAAFRGDTPDYLAYAASKGGMVAMSRSLARAYGKQGIKSFVIAPGFTRTDMAQQFIDEYGEGFALNDIALSQLTEPQDIAPTVLFLASGHMDHATGCSIDINAGSYVR